MRNWRVRTRLIAVIAIPTIVAIGLGAIRLLDTVNDAVSYQRVAAKADLAVQTTKLAYDLGAERDLTAGYLASGRAHPLAKRLKQQYKKVDTDLPALRSAAGKIDSSFNAETATKTNAVVSRLRDITFFRQTAKKTNTPPGVLIERYSDAISDVLSVNDTVAQGSDNEQLAENVRTLSALSESEEQASVQRGLLYAVLERGGFDLGEANSLRDAQSQQASELAAFQAAATVPQFQKYEDTVASGDTDQAQGLLDRVLSKPSATAVEGHVHVGKRPARAARSWYNSQTASIDAMRSVEGGLVNSIDTQANDLLASARRTAVEDAIGIVVILLLVLLITIMVARSLTRPLRKLRLGALDVAQTRLPDMVRRLREADPGGVDAEVVPIDVHSEDEIGQVARSFDEVHREAVRLAVDEALLRSNVNAMFVNLSRRSQSLIERQLRLIDGLEQGEQDAERLDSLFKLDHLATRMRRNGENLLVLAGQEQVRKWSRPVPLVDVLRAALSEVEQYKRVELNVQPGYSVAGQAVNDIVHLVAELVENATTFSPQETQVSVGAKPLHGGGGVMLEISDLGIGMSEAECAEANERLARPPVVDVSVSRRMGLFVVGRLAGRHGISVQLRPATGGGLTVLALLPDGVAGRTEAMARSGGTGSADRQDSLQAQLAAAGIAPESPAFGISQAPQPAQLEPPEPHTTQEQAPAPAANPGPMSARSAFGTDPEPSLPSRPARRFDTAEPAQVTEPAPPSPVFDTAAQRRLQPNVEESYAAGEQPLPRRGAERSYQTGDQPVVSARPWRDTGEQPALALGPTTSPGGFSAVSDRQSSSSEERSPIFDAIESEWFRRGSAQPPTPSPTTKQPKETPSWRSPADEGFRAAEAARAPAASGTTQAGLPRRTPRANLVPGTAGISKASNGSTATTTPAPPAPQPPPARSADAARDRFASFQQGIKDARSAAREGRSEDMR